MTFTIILKIQVIQALKPQHFNSQVLFRQQMLNVIGQDGELVHNFWISDEAIFHLSGYVNKQNFRYWRGNNPRTHKNPLHSEQVTVWCAMSFQGVVDPVFFKSGNGNMVAVNSERYADMLVNFAQPDLDEFVNEET